MPNNELVSLSPTATLVGRDVFPVAYGMTRFASGPIDTATKLFPPTHDNDTEQIGQVLTAYNFGYQVFDTAASYGDSEVLLGQALREMNRDEVIIITKVGVTPTENIQGAMERSGQRLGTVPDVIALHDRWDGEEPPMLHAIEDLNKGVEKGFAGAIAVCNLRPEEYIKSIEVSERPFAFYQAKLNVFHPRGDASQILQINRGRNIPYMGSAGFDNGKVFKDEFKGQKPEVESLISRLERKYEMTRAQVCLFAVMSLRVIPIVESHTPENMFENTQTMDLEMEQQDVDTLQEILLGN